MKNIKMTIKKITKDEIVIINKRKPGKMPDRGVRRIQFLIIEGWTKKRYGYIFMCNYLYI
jgi:hypothetical protein